MTDIWKITKWPYWVKYAPNLKSKPTFIPPTFKTDGKKWPYFLDLRHVQPGMAIL